MGRSKTILFPVDKTKGNKLIQYGEGTEPNFEFYDEMELVTSRYHKSFYVKSNITGNCYTLFPTDFDDMLTRTDIIKGVIKGIFTFCKKGEKFGVKFLRNRDD